MRKSILTVITCVLLLALLAVPMTAYADTDTETTPANPAFAEVDEYRIVTPNYRSAWKGSTITNKYGVYSPASDGPYNGALQWTVADAATLDADGVLSFPANGTNCYLSFRPQQNSAHNISAGPVRIAIEIYHDATTPKVSYEGTGEWYFHINGDGKLYYNSNRWWEPSKSNTGYTLTEGWNTIEMLFIPVCEDGTVSTASTDTIAENHLYLRAYPSGSQTANADCYTSEDLANNFYHASLGTNDRKHFAGGISTSYFILTDKDSADGVTDTLKIRSAMAAKLNPYIEIPTAYYLGYESLNQVITPGQAIVLPSADDVVAWVTEDNTCYLPGEEYTSEVSVSFTPVLGEMFRVVNGYDSAVQWASGRPTSTSWGTNYHPGDGQSPVLQWYGTENATDGSARGWTYDETDKSVLVYKCDWNDISLYPKKSTVDDVSFSDANRVMTSFDFKYTSGGGATVKVSSEKSFTISNAGVVTVAGVEAGTLNEGWNSFKIYYIPVAFESDGTTPTAYKIYVSVNQADHGATVSMVDLVNLPCIDWTNGALPGGDGFSITFTASTGSIPIGFRNVKNNRLDATPVNNVYMEDLRRIYTVIPGDSLILPTADDVACWSDGTDLYEVGAEYTPTASFTTMTPVSAADIIFLPLVNATNTLNNATDEDIISALDALVEAMADDALDKTDARYTAAEDAKAAAITKLNNSITNQLNNIDETNATARYEILIAAIAIHKSAKTYIDADVTEALTNAITAYNTFVDKVNADVAEANAVAVALAQRPTIDVVALLADIKSKAEDAE